MESTGATIPALPGFSMRSCVPVAIKSLRICMVDGWMPNAVSPVFLDLPYLSLNPPGAAGKEKIGLPPTTSSRYMKS